MELGLRNGGLEALGDFAEDFVAAKWGYGLRNSFTAKGLFHSEPLILQQALCGYKIMSQQMVIFARGYFGLRNFVDQ